jgi:hypothetical protein
MADVHVVVVMDVGLFSGKFCNCRPGVRIPIKFFSKGLRCDVLHSVRVRDNRPPRSSKFKIRQPL